MEGELRKLISEYLTSEGAPDVSFSVERPSDLTHGDYATNAALVAAKVLGENPRTLAESLAGALTRVLADKAQLVSVAGPGFVNILLSKEAVTSAVATAAAQGEAWGRGSEREGTRVAIEYGNPNPFKEIHIGHLMSTVTGEAISRLIAAEGAVVIRDTFGGDVGPHVAKALWALQKDGVTHIESAKQIGEAYARGSKAYEEETQAKEEIDALNSKIYELVARGEGTTEEDAELLTLWREGREISMEEFRRIFTLLGTKFDYEFFDSDTTLGGTRVVEDGLSKGVFEKSDGAIIYRGEKQGLHTLVFITSRGTPTYETKDVGLAFLKEEKITCDKVFIVTGAEQKGHFQVFLAALSEIAPHVAGKMEHIAHGLLSLTSGKMSSRQGNVITASELIREITEKASERSPDPLIAEQIGVGAVKYMILRQSPGSNIIFDEEKSLSLEGDSGPYLQYALVRAVKILSYESEAAGGEAEPEMPYDIERLILHYPGVVARSARELSPNILTTYLTELAAAWNSFYAAEQVLGSPEEAYKQRVARAFANTMANGLTLLGIPTPEKM
jgi:arginyl-tRNA synthetase